MLRFLFFLFSHFPHPLLDFLTSMRPYVLCELIFGEPHELVEAEAEVDVALAEGVFGLGDVLVDLPLGFEDGFREGLDCVEELSEEGSTWSSCWRVQLPICSLRERKLIPMLY